MKVQIGGLSTQGALELTVGEWQVRAARARGCEQLLLQVGGALPFSLEVGGLEPKRWRCRAASERSRRRG